ncbi:MAG: serine/threonine-protein kinase [Gemmataceae bacterium]
MPSTDRPAEVTRTRFLAAVRASGVLSPEQADRHAASLPPLLATGPQVADALVRSGVLTRFQADRILSGKYDGLVLGQCVVLEPVAKTADSWVYKAKHRALGRMVAVRVLASGLTADPVRRAAFQDQARSAARLAHPHVLTVLDVNAVGPRLYLLTEHVDGTSLDVLVGLTGPPGVGRACEYLRQAALGLQHAHDCGVTHGRLTPAAVLVGGPAGRPAVKLAEFGFGRATAGSPVGQCPDPADFQAPELFHPAAAPTPAADLYALGCTLYFALTGRVPFPGSAAEKARLHLAAEPTPVEEVRPGVPAEVATVVRGLLAKQPDERPTAAEVAGWLARFATADDTAERSDFDFASPADGNTPFGSVTLTGLPAPATDPPRPSPRQGPPAEPLADDSSPWDGLDHEPSADRVGQVGASIGRGWLALTGVAVAVTAAVGLTAALVLRLVAK